MKQFKYRVIPEHLGWVEAKLEALGAEGWRLVSAVPDPYKEGQLLLFMEQEQPQAGEEMSPGTFNAQFDARLHETLTQAGL